jgi:hypothetical protein
MGKREKKNKWERENNLGREEDKEIIDHFLFIKS